MCNIKGLLLSNGINTNILRENIKGLSLYQVTNSSVAHGEKISALLDEIYSEAGRLYLYRDDENIFDCLFNYLDKNKLELSEHLVRLPS